MDSKNPRPSTPLQRQWASGRQLTGAQRDRKRAVDRLRSNTRRMQTASYIAGLESKVQQLTTELESLRRKSQILNQSDPAIYPSHGWEGVQDCTTDSSFELSASSMTVDIPQASVPLPLSVLDSQVYPDDVSWTRSVTALDVNAAVPEGPCTTGRGTWHSCDQNHVFHDRSSGRDAGYPLDSYVLPAPNDFTAFDSTPNSTSSDALNRGEAADCQSIFSHMLRKARSLSRSDVCSDARLNQDALIRGVLFGWNDVRNMSMFFCPLWEILRYLDRRLFRLSGTMTRLCTLRMIHSLLLVRRDEADR